MQRGNRPPLHPPLVAQKPPLNSSFFSLLSLFPPVEVIVVILYHLLSFPQINVLANSRASTCFKGPDNLCEKSDPRLLFLHIPYLCARTQFKVRQIRVE